MNISGLVAWLERVPAYKSLLQYLERGETLLLGLPRAARPSVLAGLARDLGRPVLLVVGSVERARKWYQALEQWCPEPVRPLLFPYPPVLFYERSPWPREVVNDRVRVLYRLLTAREPLIVVTSARALMLSTIPAGLFQQETTALHVGQSLDMTKTIRRWVGLGYQPVSVVEGPGQFSHRGGILDIFVPSDSFPVRIEFFGDQVDSIRRFDPGTQRSQAHVESVAIHPAREPLPLYGPQVLESLAGWFDGGGLPEAAGEIAIHREGLASAAPFPGIEFYLPFFYQEPAIILDYLPRHGLLALDDPEELADAWGGFEREAVQSRQEMEREGALPPNVPIPYLTWTEWQERTADRPHLVLGCSDGKPVEGLADHFRPNPRYGGRLGELLDSIEGMVGEGEQVVVVSRQARRLAELWGEGHEMVLPVDRLLEPPRSSLTFVRGPLEEGWGLCTGEGEQYRLLSDAEIFGWRMPEPRHIAARRRRRRAPESLYTDLNLNDVVVHVDYGVGIFRGLTTYTMGGEEREYLVVEYAGNDRLYVPVYQADRLARYAGVGDRTPTLSRLGGAEWRRIKKRARQAALRVARELLELYAVREITPGYAFGPDTPWQMELEASFPHVETPDQARAIAEVKGDMERERPMDRLVCGDAGYGKTEVALRAAFKAVMDGKQVAILVPTTVLAQQHWTTFQHRLAPFPVRVEMLSRFRTREEQSQVLKGLREGTVDIVIGTHRLLQRDVAFKDLGLVVIDEEQRFGVTHKEKLKRMRAEVDVLTMTATPIPRTLYLSLTGVRDISVIETPPEERRPVLTYIGPYDPQIARRAIVREMSRSGQVFFVHNRVQTIQMVRERLERLVPEAAIAVAHGQMKERELEDAMLRFFAGEVDVLLCTSIIESGLDIPNANTLVVERAERFGLAQLYQLRGRVGRGTRQAHAYLFYTPGRLSDEARQRLETIREAGGLGAGYSVAMRDLELRGAGEILGIRQSGHIAAVGFDLYTRLLTRAVEELRAERAGKPLPPESLSTIRLDLPLPVGLPTGYVEDVPLRLRLYRRMACMRTLEEVREMEVELRDRFGPLPPPARNLMLQLRFKILAQEAGVQAVVLEKSHLVLRIGQLGGEKRSLLQERLAGLAHVGWGDVRLPMGVDWQARLRRVLEILKECR